MEDLADELDPEIRRRSEKAAEDLVVAYETTRGWECERVGHLKIGFDVRSLGPADLQTGYRDPVHGVRRIEVKGALSLAPILIPGHVEIGPHEESRVLAQVHRHVQSGQLSAIITASRSVTR